MAEDQVKTCTSCGGTWPASRPICPACGTGLAGVTARPTAELEGEGEFDWQWLDALAPEDEGQPGAGDGPEPEGSKRAWWQFWR
jgi:hypothetical protein